MRSELEGLRRQRLVPRPRFDVTAFADSVYLSQEFKTKNCQVQITRQPGFELPKCALYPALFIRIFRQDITLSASRLLPTQQ